MVIVSLLYIIELCSVSLPHLHFRRTMAKCRPKLGPKDPNMHAGMHARRHYTPYPQAHTPLACLRVVLAHVIRSRGSGALSGYKRNECHYRLSPHSGEEKNRGASVGVASSGVRKPCSSLSQFRRRCVCAHVFVCVYVCVIPCVYVCVRVYVCGF